MGKKTKPPLRVLHAPLNYANQAYVLSQALRARGVDSSLLRYRWQVNTGADFSFNEDRVINISDDDWLSDLFGSVHDLIAEGFDIIHFWNRTLMHRRYGELFNALDVPFLKLGGPRLAFRFTGYELRRKSLELELNPYSPFRYGFDAGISEDDQKRYLDFVAPYIDAFIVQDPEMQSYLPQAHIIPRALELKQFPVCELTRNERPVVVHAPSSRLLKGSDFVMKAVETLKEEGLSFDFQLIEEMPYATALEHYRRADIVVDQLLIGWYGVVSVEAMAMGKTVIAYIRKDLTGFFRGGMPLLNANPDTIAATLRQAISDGALRQHIGRRARAFVEEVHNSRTVARSVVKLYKKMLKAPISPRIPDFSYQRAHLQDHTKPEQELNFYRRLTRGIPAASPRELEQKMDLLRSGELEAEAQRARQLAHELEALATEAAGLRGKAQLYDELQPTLPDLRGKAQRYDELQPTLPELHGKALRYDELRQILPELRDKATRYDKLEMILPELRDKAGRYDNLQPTLLVLRNKANRYDDLQPTLPALRDKARRYEEVEAELPGLRDKARRYEEVEAEAGNRTPGNPAARPGEEDAAPAPMDGEASAAGNTESAPEIVADGETTTGLPQETVPADEPMDAASFDGARTVGKKTKPPLRVLHAPLNYANQAYVLSQALRARGVDSSLLRYRWAINQARDEYNFNEDRVVDISVNEWFADMLRIVGEVSCGGYDIVHLWNRTLLYRRQDEWFNGLDLPFLRQGGARLAYRFTGYELRHKSLEMKLNRFSPFHYGFESGFGEDDQKRYLDSVAPYIDAFVVQDPEMQTYLPQAHIIPRALNLDRFPVAEVGTSLRPHVVHAPSNRLLKGSKFIVEAAQKLQDEGLDFSFQLIEDIPYEEALEHYRRADIVIDQLLIGWYGVVSLEAMAMGKTVIAYIRDDLTGFFRDGMPLLNANPETITATLRRAIQDRELRRELGHRARSFVEVVHDSRVIARSTVKLYERILETPAPRQAPDFSYLTARMPEINLSEHELEFYKGLTRGIPAKDPAELNRKVELLRSGKLEAEAQRAGQLAHELEVLATEAAALRGKAQRYDELQPALPELHGKALRYDELQPILPALRYDAQQYEQLKSQLPALRYKALRYDEVKKQLPAWRSKAELYDNVVSKPWIKFVLPLFGVGLSAKSRRPQKIAAAVVGNRTPADSPARPGEQDAAPAPAEAEADGADNTEPAEEIVSDGEPATETPQEPVLADEAMEADASGGATEHAQLTEENDKLRAELAELQGEHRRAEGLADIFRENHVVNAYLRVARFIHDRADEIKAEAYVAHGVEALPGVAAVAKEVGGRVYCDVIEIPSFGQRSVAYNLHPTALAMLDHAFEGYLRHSAGMLTIGWALKDQILHYGPPVTVIPNYRYAEQLERSDQMREKCGIGPGDRLLLASSTICSGFEPVIEALALLPDNVHLATLGNIVREYREQIRDLPERLGVANRVHYFDAVPYAQLTTAASSANIGIMAIDPSLLNDRISLPNRLFDSIAAGLPIVTPDVPDIARIVRQRNIGVTVPVNDAGSWAEAIRAVLAQEEAMRPNVLTAAKELVWETLGDQLHGALGHPESVTLLAYCDLIGHQRTVRIADTLVKRGVKVTHCCPRNEPASPDEMPGVRFVFTPSPLATAPPSRWAVARTAAVAQSAAAAPTARTAAAPPPAPAAKANGADAPPVPAADERPAGGNGAAAPNGQAALDLSVSDIPLTKAEQLTFERLKKEVFALRYKARRYDEVKDQLPALQAKAARYDRRGGIKAGGLFGPLWRGSRPVADDGDGTGVASKPPSS